MKSDLWNFALNLYAQPDVEATCLALQEEGANVCLLLCAAWLEHRGVEPSRQRLEQLHAAAQPWSDEVVEPLRHLRQQWRQAAEKDNALAALRMEVKKLELEAEHQLLTRLQMLTTAWPPGGPGHCVTGWLEMLTPPGKTNDRHRQALQSLRVAMAAMTQEADDGL